MSGGGSDVGKKAAQAQADTSRWLMDVTRPGRDKFFEQVLAALGGDASKIPVAGRAGSNLDFAKDTTIDDAMKMANKLGFSQDTSRSIAEPIAQRGTQAKNDVVDQILKTYQGYGPGLLVQPAQLAQSGLAPAVQRGQANAAAKKQADTQTAASSGAAAAAITAALIIALL